MIVEIPLVTEHEGIWSAKYEISDKCPICGGPRGEIFRGLSYDGSRRLGVDCWKNPCGHVDKYDDIRKEGVRIR